MGPFGSEGLRAMVRSAVAAVAAALFLAGLTAAAEGDPGSGRAHNYWLSAQGAPLTVSGAWGAEHLEDRGHIAILELDGDYSKEIGGVFNDEPRRVVAQEFYRTHRDDFDFLVVFTNFEFETGEARAFFLGTRNDVEGIGRPIFDQSAAFGSAGRLEGYVDMAALSRSSTDPFDPGFEEVLGTLAHEVMHRWCCYVGYRTPGGLDSGALLGVESSHWSFLLDSDASLMYGADWIDNGDGTFTAAATRTFFSPLDLYLAGLYGPGEVPPFRLIESPGTDPAQITPQGGVVTGTAETVTVEDVVAVEGVRSPRAADSPRQLRAGFVLLTRPGDPVTPRQVAAVDGVSRHFATRFAVLTGGRAIMHTLPAVEVSGDPGTPSSPSAGDPRDPATLRLADGLAWLRSRQTPEGFWRDAAGTRVRDTAEVLATLTGLDPLFTREAEARVWLLGQAAGQIADPATGSTDSLARIASRLPGENGTALEEIAARQNADGGWGIDTTVASDAVDTAVALRALAENPGTPSAAASAAVQLLQAAQNADGGWGSHPRAPSRISVTLGVLRALAAAGGLEPVLPAALDWIANRQNAADGGFGDSPSSAADTALVIETLADLDALDRIVVAPAQFFLASRQTVEGSWEGSVYATARAVSALKTLRFPNWSLASAPVAEPMDPRDGERVRVEVRVINSGETTAPATVARLFDGDPAGGALAAAPDVEIPELEAGQTATIAFLWDTLDLEGSHTLFVVVDPDGLVEEVSEEDNGGSVEIEVAAAPAGVDLEVRSEELLIAPAAPAALPADLAISVVVRNLGRTDAENVSVRLWLGEPATGALIGETVLPLLVQRTSQAANFSYRLETPGTSLFVVEAGSDQPDANLADNRAERSLTTSPSLDLEILGGDLQVSASPALLGTDVTISARIRNRGTLDSATFDVVYVIVDAGGATLIRTLDTQIPAGVAITQDVVWRVDRVGDLELRVELDPGNTVIEVDEGNNAASLLFTAAEITGANLSVASADLVFDPDPGLEGAPVTLGASVRNTGAVRAENVEVAFFDGDPAQGGSALGSATLAVLEAGQEQTASVTAPAVVGAADRLIFVVIDPADGIVEVDEEDNKAFRELRILSLPDLAVSPSSLSLQPAFPVPGEALILEVTVANLGEQPAGPFVVRAFLGDPAAGGGQVGGDRPLSVAGLSSGVAAFEFSLPATGSSTLFVEVDALEEIAESGEANNVAELDLAVQDGDFFVSERFFSPNGDGVKDATRLFYRLDTSALADVEVVDENGEVVRRRRAEIPAATGSFLWDGLDDLGRVADDGTYRIQVRDGLGALLGAATTTLDTDRAPLLLALDTEFERFTNLTCELGEIGRVVPAPSGDWVYFTATSATQAFPAGVYRTRPDGADLESLFSIASLNSLVLDVDESRIAFGFFSSSGAQIWVMEASGEGARFVESPALLLSFTPDGAGLVLRSAANAIEIVPLDGSLSREVLLPLSLALGASKLSPTGRHLAVKDGFSTRSGPADLWILDLEERTATRAERAVGIRGAEGLSWSPDGSRLAVGDLAAERIAIFGLDGTLLQTLPIPTDPYPASLLPADQAAELPSPWEPDLFELRSDWSDDGSELAVLAQFGLDLDGYWRLLLTDLRSGGQETVAWSEPLRVNTGPDFLTHGPGPSMDPTSDPTADPTFEAATAGIGEPRSLLPVPIEDLLWWRPDERLLFTGPWAVDLTENNSLRLLFDDFERLDPADFLSANRGLLFTSPDAALDVTSSCVNKGRSDLFSFLSLLNLTADLRPGLLVEGSGFDLRGTASDLNFAAFQLEWSLPSDPPQWHPVAPPSSRRVIDGRLGTWLPPDAGQFLVRLTAEDQAGNRRFSVKRVINTEVSALANVFVTPEFFSSSGGSTTANQAEVFYDVLAPTEVDFRISGPAGEPVRNLRAIHFSPAVAQSVIWNGLDEAGRPVPDGEYRIEVRGFVMSVTVDSTPPAILGEIEVVLQNTERELCGSEEIEIAVLGHSFTFEGSDSNLSEARLERAPFDGSAWEEIGECVSPISETALLCGDSPALSELTSSRWRVSAGDAAGNRRVFVLGDAPENLVIEEAGDDLLDPLTGELVTSGLVPFFESPEAIDGDPFALRFPVRDGAIRLGVSESIRGSAGAYFVQSRRRGVPGPWLENVVDRFAPRGSLVEGPQPADHQLTLIWDPIGVPAGEEVVVRLRARDASGIDHFSNPFLLFRQDLSFEGRLQPGDLEFGRPFAIELGQLVSSSGLDPTARDVFWGVRRVSDPDSEIVVRLRSDDDQDYLDWRRVAVAGASQNVFLFAPEDLDPQAIYQVSLEVAAALPRCGPPAPAGGAGPRIDRFDFPIRDTGTLGDLDLEVSRGFVGSGQCGVLPEEVFVNLLPRARPGTALTRLTLSLLQPGGEILLLDRPDPQDRQAVRFETPAVLPLQERLIYRAVLTDVEGGRIEREISFEPDDVVPALSITRPAELAKVCSEARVRADGTSFVGFDVQGAISDNRGFDFTLELEGEDREGAPVAVALIDPNGLGAEGYPRTSFSGLLATYGDDPGEILFTGPATLRLMVGDDGGHLECREVSFTLDSELDPVSIEVSPGLFSPNLDGRLDSVEVAFGSVELATLDLRLFRESDAFDNPLPEGAPVRTLASDLSVLGAGVLAWDGLDDGGAPVPDGRYRLEADFADDCAHRRVVVARVTVDNTPPALAISAPIGDTVLGTVVEIEGSVTDLHPAGYEVSWGASHTPSTFVDLASGTGIAAGGRLAVWSTFGLEGPFTLRLAARDAAGNTAETRLALVLSPSSGVVTLLEAVPPLFSPDGDGSLDATALRFGLAAAAVADLEILDTGGAVVRVLSRAETLAAGDHLRAWDGRDSAGLSVSDGVYRARIAAAPAASPQTLEEESVSVILDTLAPEALIGSPVAGGFATGEGAVLGRAGDLHFDSYTLELAPAAPVPAWSELATSAAPVDAGELGRLDVLGPPADGAYLLRLIARDRAGHQTETRISFEIDPSPPEVSLSAPAAGALVSSSAGPAPIEIRGLVQEANLAFYRLEVGSGTAPASFSTIAEASALPVTDLLARWEPSGLADGLYTLRLSAADLAGATAAATVAVTLDNTPPQAEITSPAAGSFVTAPLAVTGTATDANFMDYSLSLAPAGSSQFALLGFGSQPVIDGPLLGWQALPADGDYLLRLEVMDRAGNRSRAETAVKVDRSAPAAPLTLQAEVIDGRDVRLIWSAVTAPDLAGYRLLRDGLPVFSGLISETVLVDASLPSGIYVYTVRAVDQAGNESEPSNETPARIDVDPPTARIQRPGEGDRVGGLVDVVGTAFSSDDFKELRLFAGAASDPAASTLLARSPVPIQGALVARWETFSLAQETLFVLRLEAEDLSGNVGVDEIRVTLDNLPPASPTGLTAAVAGTDVELSWSPNAEPDLAGYLVFRDGALANADGPVVGDLRPFLIPPTDLAGALESFVDLALPDGTFFYRVVAVDEAGNESPPSAPASATIETGAPRATIAVPEEGHRFEEPLYVLATAPDQDLAQVRLQFQAAVATAWTDIAMPSSEPFEGVWDPTGLDRGEYRLRAVATDTGERTDLAPPAITIFHADVTPPSPVLDLRVDSVLGGDVSLSWQANTGDADLAGFHLFRRQEGGEEIRITAGPVTASALVDAGVADGSYTYTARAVDLEGNLSLSSAEVEALVYTPALAAVESPTALAVLEVSGSGPVAGAALSGELENSAGSSPLSPQSTEADGTFQISGLPLTRGPNLLHLRLTDTAGNVSKDAVASVISAPPPAAPTWQGATVVDQGAVADLTLSWNPGSEPDLFAYRPLREGVPLAAEEVLEVYDGASASSSLSTFLSAPNVIDGDSSTSWNPDVSFLEELPGEWLAVEWSGPRLVSGLRLEWRFRRLAEDFDIEAWLQGSWRLVGQVRGASGDATVAALDRPVLAEKLRFVVVSSANFVQVAEMRALHLPLVAGLTAQDQQPIGTYFYTLTAFNDSGFESPPSAPLEVVVGDPTPPLTVVLSAEVQGSNVLLSWTASGLPGTPEVARYDLFRDGLRIAEHADLGNLTFLDPALANGIYRYRIVAVSLAGRSSEPSNEVVATIDLEALAAPRIFSPARPGFPFLTDQTVVDVRGLSVSGTLVTLLRGGAEVATAPAAAAAAVVPLASGVETVRLSPQGEAALLTGPSTFPPLVLDLATGVETPVQGVLGEARWSPSGEELVFAGGDGRIRSYRPTDGAITELAAITSAAAALPSPDGTSLAVIGVRAGSSGLWSADPAADLWIPLVEGPLDVFDAEALSWSPDGSRLLFRRLTPSPSLEMIHLSSAVIQLVESAPGPSLPGFSPDGSTIAFTAAGAAGEQVWIFRLADGSREPVTVGPGEHREPRWSPAGDRLAYLSADGRLLERDLQSGRESVVVDLYSPLASGDPTILSQWRWSPAGGRIFNLFGELGRVEEQGVFEIFGVAVAAGDNLLTAYAADDLGRVSDVSEAAIVTVMTDRPDLAIEAGGLTLLPPLPRIGEPVSAAVEIRNLGSLGAPASEVALTLLDPVGLTIAAPAPTPVGALAAGGDAIVIFELSGLPEAGLFQIELEVDPGDAILEVTESNNRRVATLTVVGDAAPTLGVTTDRPDYGAMEDVISTIEILNAGDVFDGTLEVALEDGDGFLVAALAEVEVTGLAFGAVSTETVTWNTGSTFAGAYRIRAVLRDAAGLATAEASAAFTVREEIELAATAETDRVFYVVGETVRATGSLTFVTGNALLTGARAVLAVSDAGGVRVAEWAQDLGLLLPGSSFDLSRDWSTGTSAPGAYQVVFEIRREDGVLAAAVGDFEIRDSAPVFAELIATKTAELAADVDGDGRITPGDRLRYRIGIANTGTGTATTLVLEDPIPASTSVDPLSLTSSHGVVESADPVRVSIPTLASGEAAEIVFEVTIAASLAPGTSAISNQGILDADGVSGLPTDDPDTPEPADATVTRVFDAPELAAIKSDRLFDDRDGDGVPGPGDVIEYAIEIANTGNRPATQIRLVDAIPAHASPVAGTVTATAEGIILSEDPIEVTFGALGRGEQAIVTFRIEIDSPIPPEIRWIENQGLVVSAELPVVLTDDPDRGGESDATLTAVTAAPLLLVEKTDLLVTDLLGDGLAGPGDEIEYSLAMRNLGNTSARGIVLFDEIPVGVSSVAGSVSATGGEVISEAPLEVGFDTLAAGSAHTVTFRVRLDDPPPPDLEEIVNQATVTALGVDPELSDDPRLPGAADPTVIPIAVGREVEIWIADLVVSEGAGFAIAAVSLSAPAAGEITVAYATADGTAMAGADYGASAGTLTFATGEIETGITLEIIDDPVLELEVEEFRVELSDPVGATLARASALVSVLDDEICAGPDLLVNSGFELAPPPDAAAGSVSGWSAVAGDGWHLRLTEPEPFEGASYLAAGAVETAELLQDVDLAPYAAAVESGARSFTFTAWTRTAGDDIEPDRARVVVEFLDEARVTILDFHDFGEISSVDAWRELGEVLPAPAAARWLRVRLIATRVVGDEADVFFDGLSLRSLRVAVASIADVAVLEGDPGPGHSISRVFLSCPSHQASFFDYSTRDGSAIAGEDYLAAAGTVEIPAGEAEGEIAVEIVADGVDEVHEHFSIDLVAAADAATVLLDGEGEVEIRNDDFCPREVEFWEEKPSFWPLSELRLGETVFAGADLAELLDPEDPEVPDELAREWAAAVFNLEIGSPPWILPLVEEAEELLSAHPPGSEPAGETEARMAELASELENYNEAEGVICDQGSRRFDCSDDDGDDGGSDFECGDDDGDD